MAANYFLAFDLGAESGRALLGTLEGGQLRLEEQHRFANPTGRLRRRLQWNVLQQWEEIKTGLRKTLTRRLPIAGIGVDTWGVDFALLDRQGNLLGNAVHYRDARTDGMMERAFALVSRREIFESTGIQFMQFNTLYQMLAMKLGDDAQLAAADKLLLMGDLFHYLMTGVARCEFSNASTSQMCDAQTRDWDRAMLSRFGLPVGLLPPIVPPGTVLGGLTRDVMEECGIEGAADVRVITPATHDTGSAVAATPAEGKDWCYISSGTWSLMGVELEEPIINDKSLKYNYTNEGGIDGTVRFLKNIMGLWLVQECRREFQRAGAEHSYAELTAMANEAEELKTLIDPDHLPFLAPGQMPQKITAYCQATRQTAPSSQGAMVRCCLESLALTYRKTLENLEDLVGRRLGVIHIVGGGSRNDLLNQMTADACGRPVIAGPVEATAIGNILVQGMAVGVIPSLTAARGIVRESFPVKRYEPRGDKKWEEAYGRFRELLAADRK